VSLCRFFLCHTVGRRTACGGLSSQEGGSGLPSDSGPSQGAAFAGLSQGCFRRRHPRHSRGARHVGRGALVSFLRFFSSCMRGPSRVCGCLAPRGGRGRAGVVRRAAAPRTAWPPACFPRGRLPRQRPCRLSSQRPPCAARYFSPVSLSLSSPAARGARPSPATVKTGSPLPLRGAGALIFTLVKATRSGSAQSAWCSPSLPWLLFLRVRSCTGPPLLCPPFIFPWSRLF